MQSWEKRASLALGLGQRSGKKSNADGENVPHAFLRKMKGSEGISSGHGGFDYGFGNSSFTASISIVFLSPFNSIG